MIPAANTIATWSGLLMDTLERSGVRDVIVSPGSRSTPFVLAAAAQPGLRVRHTIDERSAAFQAVGMAKVTGEPVVLLCTSGTAPAHYLPAVIEASLSFVPVLVLSADRPLSLQGCGAPQTVDQVKLFGDHVRWYADLEEPAPRIGALAAMRRIVAQAVLTCRHPLPGPVHLNARACKPLEPGPATTVEERDAAAWAQQAARDAIRTPVPEVRASDSTCDELADMIRATERGVIVCGPAPLSQRRDRQAVFALARRSRLPLLAEATSQLRFAPDRNTDTLDAFDTVLHTAWGRSRFSPDLIVQLGAAPTSGAWARWPKPQHTRRVVIAPFGWQDPQNDVSLMVSAPIGPTVAEVAKRLAPPDGPTMWQEQVAGWDAAVWSAADALVAPHLPHTLDEPLCVRELVRALPSGALLGVGNSLPVRMLDTWCQGSTSDIAVWSQRGANGIDGVVSGMSGAARAWGGPAALLVGDVSFVHDIGGLAAARDLAHPLVVVVVNNGGGRIFEQLPIADLDQARGCFELWTTPPDVSLAHVSASYGLRHVRAEDGEGLRGALASALSRPGCTIVEAVVPASDAFQRNKALWDAVASRCAP